MRFAHRKQFVYRKQTDVCPVISTTGLFDKFFRLQEQCLNSQTKATGANNKTFKSRFHIQNTIICKFHCFSRNMLQYEGQRSGGSDVVVGYLQMRNGGPGIHFRCSVPLTINFFPFSLSSFSFSKAGRASEPPVNTPLAGDNSSPPRSTDCSNTVGWLVISSANTDLGGQYVSDWLRHPEVIVTLTYDAA